MRSTVAYDMFEVFYPIELTITPPGCKSFSCEIFDSNSCSNSDVVVICYIQLIVCNSIQI